MDWVTIYEIIVLFCHFCYFNMVCNFLQINTHGKVAHFYYIFYAVADVGVLLQESENTEIKRIPLHSWLTMFWCLLLMWNIYFTTHSSDNYIWIVYGFSVRWENVKHKQGIRKAVIIKYVKYCTGTSFCVSVRMKNEYKSKHMQAFRGLRKHNTILV